jgi:hypothetical protein
MFEITDILSEVTGKNLRYIEATPEQAEERMLQMGASSAIVRDNLKMFDAIRAGRLGGDRNKVYNEFNFDPTPLETVLSTVAGAIAV